MTLYKYKIDYNSKFVCREEPGFEEKKKTFCRTCRYPQRVNKENIGKVKNGFVYPELWLREKDDEKAKTMLREWYQKKMESDKRKYEQTLLEYKNIIDGLN